MHKKEVKPYDDQNTSKKQEVTKMFDRIAPIYDFLNGLLSLGIDSIWRRKAIKKLADNPPKTLIDIATGTADLALEAKKQLHCEKIVGLDISSKMIELAKKKIQKKGLEASMSFEVGDSENLRFEDGSFEAVTAAFGVRNFGNLEAGLQEMYRILSTNGRMVILEFSRPTIFPFKQMFNVYFKYILPFIGKITSKDPKAYKYLYESVQIFPDYEAFADILKQIGFTNISWKPLSLGICTIYYAEK